MKRGQAMIETVLAVLFISILFLSAFQFSQMLTARTVLDHAAARAARSKSVGFNEFMCLKTARSAMIPVSGKRLWPETLLQNTEAYIIPAYLDADTPADARGLLDYEYWDTTDYDFTDSGTRVRAYLRMETEDFTMDGEAELESHAPLYMYDQGR